MVKFLVLFRRKPGLSDQEFHRHWKDVHGPLVMSAPASVKYIRKYVQNHNIETSLSTQAMAEPRYGSPAGNFDGVMEMWFDNLGEMENWLAEIGSDQSIQKAIMDDEDKFMDPKHVVAMVADEITIHG